MFAVLHLADFALQAVLRTDPADAHRPAALFASTTKKSVVLALNSRARAAGVELRMTAPQAVARCPSLLIRTVQAAAEAEARGTLLAIGFTLSPRVEDTAPGICSVDLQGCDPAKIYSAATSAVAALTRLGLPATCGLAATPLLALYAARAAKNVLRVEEPAAFLAPLPLITADPSAELANVLAHWGLRTIGDFITLPRDEIVRRFGADGLALWHRASGGAPRPLRPVALPRNFSAEMEFADALETLEPLLFVARRFLDRLTLELNAAQLATAEVEMTLFLEDETRHARTFRLPEPTADPEILFRPLHTHLESLQTATAISALSLRLVPTRPLVRQQALFESGLRDAHGFAETLARAMAIISSDRVGTPQCDDTHRADAVTLTTPAVVIAAPAAAPLHPDVGLPLRRYRPPLPVRLEFTAGRPTYLWTEAFHGEIVRHVGPWPSSGDWWQNDRAWQRQDWDIALAAGGLYRLLLIGDAYFIEGEYD